VCIPEMEIVNQLPAPESNRKGGFGSTDQPKPVTTLS